MTTTPSAPPGVNVMGVFGARPRRRPSKDWTGWVFVAPFLLVFTVAFIAPLVFAAYLSLYRRQLVGGTTFVGMDNYVALLTDESLRSGLVRVLLFLVVQVPIMLGLALVAALAIDSARLHGPRFFRFVIFLPYAVPAVVATLMWGFIYGDRFGLAGSFNNAIGAQLITPFAPDWLLLSIGNIVTWQYVGYNMLIFYSALKTIPSDLFEAAALDGAGHIGVIRWIKLPSLRGALVIATLFSIIGSFQLFNEPNILRPLASNVITTDYTPNMYAFNLSFAGQQNDYAAAVAIFMGLVTAAIAFAVQARGSRSEGVR